MGLGGGVNRRTLVPSESSNGPPEEHRARPGACCFYRANPFAIADGQSRLEAIFESSRSISR